MKPIGYLSESGAERLRKNGLIGYAEARNKPGVSIALKDYTVPIYVEEQINQYRAIFGDYDSELPTFEQCADMFQKMRTRIIELETPVQSRRYRHYRGDVYVLLTEGKLESEGNTNNTMAVYKSEVDGKVWIRPMMEFLDFVRHNGHYVNRFTRLEE